MMVTFLVCCFIVSILCDRSLHSDRIRVKRSSDALCTKRPEGCFCQGQDNGCKSCNGGGCCMCDEYCLTANDCCSDFRTYCIKSCTEINCQNGGLCQEHNNRFSNCDCLQKYSGTFCEIDLCQPFPSDVVFVLDNSYSIHNQYFDEGKQYISSLSPNMTIDSNVFEIAVISFSDHAIVEHDFGSISSHADFAQKISGIELKNRTSEIVQGLNKARDILFKRLHLQRKKFVVILTDGLISTPSQLTISYSSAIPVYALAIGEDVSHFYLEKMTSSMGRVFTTNSDRLWSHILAETFNGICNYCSKSSETDVILAVDISVSMHGHDLLTTVPDIMNKILVKMGDVSNDAQLSLITFDQTVNTEFDFMKVSPENKSLLQRRLSSFTQSNYNVAANISNLLTTVQRVFNQNTNGARHDAKKVLLIISRFSADVDDKISIVSNDLKTKGIEIFTIGLDNNDKPFRTMLSVAPNALHIGTVGELNVDSVNTFIDFFGYQLMDLKCIF